MGRVSAPRRLAQQPPLQAVGGPFHDKSPPKAPHPMVRATRSETESDGQRQSHHRCNRRRSRLPTGVDCTVPCRSSVRSTGSASSAGHSNAGPARSLDGTTAMCRTARPKQSETGSNAYSVRRSDFEISGTTGSGVALIQRPQLGATPKPQPRLNPTSPLRPRLQKCRTCVDDRLPTVRPDIESRNLNAGSSKLLIDRQEPASI